jgi:hypothetical protein
MTMRLRRLLRRVEPGIDAAPRGTGSPGAAKRQHWPEFAVDGLASSVTSRHFHDNLIGSDFRKMIL